MKTKYWILLIAALLALSLGLSLWLFAPRSRANSVKVYSDGKLLHTLDLSEDTTLTVTSDRGSNVITVKDGKIAVTEADCPDQYCQKRGYCSTGPSIVCLPNRLVLEFIDKR